MMDKRKKQRIILWSLLAGILVIDQIVKILVKTNMHIGEEIPLIGSWCMLHFVENQGFAFGMAWGGSVGKYILTAFRFVASIALMWYLLHLIKKGTRTPLVICLALIVAPSATSSTAAFTASSSTRATSTWRSSSRPKAAMPPSCRAAWWICSTSPSSTPCCPHGCPSGAADPSSSSTPSSTWLMPPSPSVLYG